jgi:hypothetical protein
MSRKTSRKLIIALAAAAALAAPLLGSSESFARGFGGGGMHFGGGGMHFGGGRAMVAHRATGFHFSRVTRVGRVGRIGRIRPIFPRHPIHPIWIGHLHHFHHWHWVLRGGRWIDVDDAAVADVTPVPVTPAVAPGPCTCLTKTYTQTGLVVFADICTKESASAPATDDTADASQAPSTPVPAKATPIAEVPTAPNFAGKTYQDYLAANPQNANPQASTQAPQAN